MTTEKCALFEALWKSFDDLMLALRVDPDSAGYLTPEEFSLEAQKFASLVHDAGIPFTPYMHVLVHHIPEFLKRYKTIYQYSTQTLELMNCMMVFPTLSVLTHRILFFIDALQRMVARSASCFSCLHTAIACSLLSDTKKCSVSNASITAKRGSQLIKAHYGFQACFLAV